MSITIEVPPHELAALKQRTRIDNDAEAILQAAREYLRLTGLRELKAASGKVEVDLKWKELEDLELAESPLPR